MTTVSIENKKLDDAECTSKVAGGESIKLMTYNLGLLRLRILYKFEVFANPPFADERFAHIPKALAESGADVIALQEIYEDGHVNDLVDAVKGVYPYSARGHERDNGKWCETDGHAKETSPGVVSSIFQWPTGKIPSGLKFHNGLLLLSKYPIESYALIKHGKAAQLENAMGSKCMLAVRVRSPIGPLFLVNMHPTAGGELKPEEANGLRQEELEEAVALCQNELKADAATKAIIIGDLNCGPDASIVNYEYVLKSGFEDALAEKDNTEWCTWDPENPLNKVGPHADAPPQRIDLFLMHKKSCLESIDASMHFKIPCVETAQGLSTMSDHYGVMTTLRVKGNL